jgi:hypothetical protein
VARKVASSSCVFCGEHRAVRSRVLPKWLDACFPEHPPLAAERALACKHCTRGWLATVEEHAMPLVEWMSGGRPFMLAQQNQELVAFWGVKTILLLQAIRDPELLPLEVYRRMYEMRTPPPGFRVAVALRPREGRWPYRFAAQGSATTLREWDVEPTYADTEIDHYRAELCIGQLVIRAAANFTPHARPIAHGSAAIEIWPARAPVQFPPARGLVRAQRAV